MDDHHLVCTGLLTLIAHLLPIRRQFAGTAGAACATRPLAHAHALEGMRHVHSLIIGIALAALVAP
ncbi:hypothetical protein ACFWBB_01850 [Streptomyces sp. NPDC060000]|uniref:hypothetical protein n=1 Tax=Streptomyces sp. NPDC060000 TaxID=3347031 RepID=UPI0036C5F543